jgi:hypothetical protein
MFRGDCESELDSGLTTLPLKLSIPRSGRSTVFIVIFKHLVIYQRLVSGLEQLRHIR